MRLAWGIVAALVVVLLALALGYFHFEQPQGSLFTIEPGGVRYGMTDAGARRFSDATRIGDGPTHRVGPPTLSVDGPRSLNIGVIS